MINRKGLFFQSLAFTHFISAITLSLYLTAIKSNGLVWAQEPTAEAGHAQPRFNSPILTETELQRLARRGSPTGRVGAGSRSDCPAPQPDSPNLTALVPLSQLIEENASTDLAISTTIADHPTFWVYIPYTADTLHTVRFVLTDEMDTPVTDPIDVPLPEIPGLVSFQLPASVPSLEVGQYYRWYVLLDCLPAGSSDIFTEAFIHRVAPTADLASQLQTATPPERVNLYLENGFWHEALTEINTLRQAPDYDRSWDATWQELLSIGGL